MCHSYSAYVYSKWVWEKQKRQNRKLNQKWKDCTEAGEWFRSRPVWLTSLNVVFIVSQKERAWKRWKRNSYMHPKMGYANFPNDQGPSLSISAFQVKGWLSKILIWSWGKGKGNGILFGKCSLVYTRSPKRARVLARTNPISINENCVAKAPAHHIPSFSDPASLHKA